ncbi:UNVERIFIED_CONTAM: hypothetical protein GTU68_036178 [Idotea baltica]|nr:hypothetical protein [Idotea baltica]
MEDYQLGDKKIPFRVIGEHKGAEFEGCEYEQLLAYQQPEEGDAFKVILGDFVTTEDGTGIVHIAPSFGADDMRIAKQNGIGSLTLVDTQGKFIDGVGEFSGRYVKNYKYIAVKLKKENKAFKIEKYEHSYPHCWRTDKPIIYYPLDSWFIKVTDYKDRMVELNKTINWKPSSTGTGRFGNWLENLLDWNLSRSRFWGTPLPIWKTKEGTEEKCIGSIAELRAEDAELDENFDLHKPYVDNIILIADSGAAMYRENDLVDVWFDSGAMPYAQWHFPFENKETFEKNFPADFIAEGVDQTRGWFYTLHAIAVMLYDSVAYKNVVSNGLLLDKNGNKMSKRVGNVVDPFETIDKYGADTARWYMISNSQPWDNLKFDVAGLQEVQRKFFGTLSNTYSFFSLYANVDGFKYGQTDIIPVADRSEIDKWVISKLHSLIKFVDEQLDNYEPTKACRAIQNFVDEHLSNWYVRLCRKRFWNQIKLTDPGAEAADKLAAYQTLHECLSAIFKLMSPVAPFISDFFYQRLVFDEAISIHLSDFPKANSNYISTELEEQMYLAQTISSLTLALRKKVNIKVRQPLQKILVPVRTQNQQAQIERVQDLIKNELNIKEIEFADANSAIFTKSIKPNFKMLGKKLGKNMRAVQQLINAMDQTAIAKIESDGKATLSIGDETIEILLEEFEITTNDIPGMTVNQTNGIIVALDTQLNDALIAEGHARELINKIQRQRKDNGYEVTDTIKVEFESNDQLSPAINDFKDYICSETLISELTFTDKLEGDFLSFDINQIPLKTKISLFN